MINRRHFVLLLAIATLSLQSLVVFSQNITPDMIEKAKAAGVSQQQIDAAMKQQSATATTAAVQPVVNQSPEIDRNAKAAAYYNDPVTIPSDEKEMMVYGREIFSQKNLTFAPNFNIATPKSYKIGPGDELVINIWGSSEDNLSKRVSPEGRIVIPSVGPITLGGLSIEGAESKLRSAMSKIYAGINNGTTRLSLSLGNIRSIKVNMVGEVVAPGTYTLPSLATLFNALYIAGGVNKIGSLRDVKVYRNSHLVGELDVYDYLLNGKYTSNVRLEDNDMIVVSPFEKVVVISGNIKRPRKFEMKKGETLADLIRFSGSFTSDAYSENLAVKRSNGKEYEVYTVDKQDFVSFNLQDGDEVSVGQILDRYSNRVQINGAVYRHGAYALTDKLNTLMQLINKAEGIKDEAFLNRAQIIRTLPDLSKQNIAVDLNVLLTNKIADIPLQKWDVVNIPSIYDLIGDYTVTIAGAVAKPNTLPFKKGMTIEDLILDAGGLKYEASLQRIEVARRIRDPHSTSTSEKIAEKFLFNINGDFKISPEAKLFELEPYDEVFVRVSPGYESQQRVSIRGEVLFAGQYVLTTKDQRLSDVLKSAGGLTNQAYIKGAQLTRKISEDERLKLRTLVKLARQSRNDSIEMSKLDLVSEYSIGINLPGALESPNSEDDIVLREGDAIFVPKFNNTVKISGSVLYPNTVVFKSNSSFKDYVSQAGGFDARARKNRAFVIYMNGTVAKKNFFRSPRIEPGCEIVVPTKAERKGLSTAEVLGYTSSTASIAAMIATMINVLK